MGFIERLEDGEEHVLVPTLSFTRLALRDNADTFDSLFNLYQKGSLDVDIILELLNIDPVATKEKLKRDVLTFQDPNFNEVLRSAYSRVGDEVVQKSNMLDKVLEEMGLDKVEAEGEDPRF
jgi:hypothetical protein